MSDYRKIPVLIVDDRPENLTSMETLLNDMELDLVTAQSGNEALRLTLYADFALVLLDVQMPEMDGFETAELMRKNPKTRELPIIFVTAGIKEEYQIFRGYEAGAVDYLMKPIEPAILRSKVRVFCELFGQRRELRRIQAELEMKNANLQESFQLLEKETAQRIQMMEELRQKDQMLVMQDRLSVMGEMINNIAHQWNQPLNQLGLVVQQLPMHEEFGTLTREVLTENTQQAMKLIKFMSQTINDFRDLFKVDKKKITFSVNEVITRTLSLIEKTFEDQRISIAFQPNGDPVAIGFPNEYSQVLLNILLNAQDALIEQKIEDRLISIHSFAEGERSVVTIADNAGGIPEEIKGKLFDAYFTTKGPDKGTGIGLFMSKAIIEKSMKGSLTVQNTRGGAVFRIDI